MDRVFGDILFEVIAYFQRFRLFPELLWSSSHPILTGDSGIKIHAMADTDRLINFLPANIYFFGFRMLSSLYQENFVHYSQFVRLFEKTLFLHTKKKYRNLIQ